MLINIIQLCAVLLGYSYATFITFPKVQIGIIARNSVAYIVRNFYGIARKGSQFRTG